MSLNTDLSIDKELESFESSYHCLKPPCLRGACFQQRTFLMVPSNSLFEAERSASVEEDNRLETIVFGLRKRGLGGTSDVVPCKRVLT
jgi:hypothetical protein